MSIDTWFANSLFIVAPALLRLSTDDPDLTTEGMQASLLGQRINKFKPGQAFWRAIEVGSRERGILRKCEWGDCSAVLDTGERLRTHVNLLHYSGKPNDKVKAIIHQKVLSLLTSLVG
jgi:hypothetical protein